MSGCVQPLRELRVRACLMSGSVGCLSLCVRAHGPGRGVRAARLSLPLRSQTPDEGPGPALLSP
eukprot:3722392-Rhodomonas_salina.1